MEELTVGDVRPLLDLAANSPILDDSETIAAQLRNILSNLGVPITNDLDAALSLIEANPILVDAGIAEFRGAIEGLPNSTLLSDIEGFGGEVSDGNEGEDSGDGTEFTQDEYGNSVQYFNLPFSETNITVDGDTVTVNLPNEEPQQLVGLDRLEFLDGTFFLDVEDGAGLVKAAYDTLLGRTEPDAEGFDFWLNLYESNTIDVFALTDSFTKTETFDEKYGDLLADAEGLLQAIYQSLFNRSADQAGLDFWSDYLENNGIAETIDDALGYMLQSDEFIGVVGSNYSDGFFV